MGLSTIMNTLTTLWNSFLVFAGTFIAYLQHYISQVSGLQRGLRKLFSGYATNMRE